MDGQKKPMKSERVSDNIKVVEMDTSGNATLVDMRRLTKDERKKYRDAPRYKDFLEVAEKRESELAAAAATAKTSPSEQTAPTPANPVEPSPVAASEK